MGVEGSGSNWLFLSSLYQLQFITFFIYTKISDYSLYQLQSVTIYHFQYLHKDFKFQLISVTISYNLLLSSFTQRFQKLIYLHLFTNCFLKISPRLSLLIQFSRSEIFVHKSLHWALFHVWFQNTFELYLLHLFTVFHSTICPLIWRKVQSETLHAITICLV